MNELFHVHTMLINEIYDVFTCACMQERIFEEAYYHYEEISNSRFSDKYSCFWYLWFDDCWKLLFFGELLPWQSELWAQIGMPNYSVSLMYMSLCVCVCDDINLMYILADNFWRDYEKLSHSCKAWSGMYMAKKVNRRVDRNSKNNTLGCSYKKLPWTF